MRFFISSTYVELKDYRKFTIEYLNHLTDNKTGDLAAMEFFAATQNSCKDECLKELENSDIVIGIYGNTYGSIDPETGKSMTEVEFDYAIEHKKPILGFVVLGEWEEAQKNFIEQKVFGQKISCARFDSLQQYADRLDESLKSYFKGFDGFSYSSLWREIKEIKKIVDKEIEKAIPHMDVYDGGCEKTAIQEMKESLTWLEGFLSDIQILYNYSQGLLPNLTSEDMPIVGWERIFLGVPNCINKLKISVFYIELCHVQYRLLVEPWTEELRKEALRAKENYIKVVEKMYYND